MSSWPGKVITQSCTVSKPLRIANPSSHMAPGCVFHRNACHLRVIGATHRRRFLRKLLRGFYGKECPPTCFAMTKRHARLHSALLEDFWAVRLLAANTNPHREALQMREICLSRVVTSAAFSATRAIRLQIHVRTIGAEHGRP